MRLRVLYYKNAEPQIFNLASILSYGYANGELSSMEPTLIIMEGFNKPFSYLGYYQDVDRELKLENCKKYNVEIVRRWKLGLGNIFMDKFTGGWALVLPKNIFSNLTQAYDILVGRVFLNAIKELGVKNAEYVRPNDIRVKGKKLCGTGITVVKNRRETFFFNGFTNLWKPDPELPFKVLNIPPEKFIDKAIKKPEEYFASIDIDGDKSPNEGDFMNSIINSLRGEIKFEPFEDELNDEELRIWNYYLKVLTSDDFIFRRSTSRFKLKNYGYKYKFSQRKFRKLVQASVALDEENNIHDVMITGDFGLAPPDIDEEIIKLLLGLNCRDFYRAVEIVSRLVEEKNYEITGATPKEFITPVFDACNSHEF
jgi:lipoate-protein ligase A